MIHLDPDFRTLHLGQREAVLHSLYAFAKQGKPERRSGLLQRDLIHAIGSSLLAVETKPDPDVDSLDALQEVVQELTEPVRHRLFHLFILSEVILDPLPEQATEALKHVASLMKIDDEFIDVGCMGQSLVIKVAHCSFNDMAGICGIKSISM